jgi:hypothetical protein
LNETVKVSKHRQKSPLLILFLILGVLSQPVLSSAVVCFSGSDHVEIEFSHDGPASFSQCQVAGSASSHARGFDIAPKEKQAQCFDVPMSCALALNHIIPLDQTSPQIEILPPDTCVAAFDGARTGHGNAILLDLLTIEMSVSLSLQNTILII